MMGVVMDVFDFFDVFSVGCVVFIDILGVEKLI